MLILRALPFSADSRASRWATIYAPRPIVWGCWGSASDYDEFNILDTRPRSGRLPLAIGYAKFVLMSFFYAFKRLRRGDTLLCIDLETALLGALAAKLRGATLHYDMADPFYLAKPVPFKWIWKHVEALYIKRAAIATAPLASRFRIFFDNVPSNCRVVENVPELVANERSKSFLPSINNRRQLTLGYFGTIEPHRGLEDLILLVKHHPNIKLLIGGRGPLTSLVLTEAELCNRIQFSGEYLPHHLPELTREVDVYCSLYYSSKALHAFAAPNKYFEHLALSIPILLSARTPYAQDVLENGTGWIVEDGLDSLEDWYQSIRDDVDTFAYFSERASALWCDRYGDWLERQSEYFLRQE